MYHILIALQVCNELNSKDLLSLALQIKQTLVLYRILYITTSLLSTKRVEIPYTAHCLLLKMLWFINAFRILISCNLKSICQIKLSKRSLSVKKRELNITFDSPEMIHCWNVKFEEVNIFNIYAFILYKYRQILVWFLQHGNTINTAETNIIVSKFRQNRRACCIFFCQMQSFAANHLCCIHSFIHSFCVVTKPSSLLHIDFKREPQLCLIKTKATFP